MTPGMKITNPNRAAVKEFRGCSRKIWGVSEIASNLHSTIMKLKKIKMIKLIIRELQTRRSQYLIASGSTRL